MEKHLEKIDLEILNSLAVGVYIIDKNYKIQFVNSYAQRLIGKDASQVLGQECKSLCRSELCEGECPVDEALKSGQIIKELDSKMNSVDGEVFRVKINVSNVADSEKKIVGSIISFRKISNESDLMALDTTSGYQGIISKSETMQQIFRTIKEVSSSDAPVLILGETGTGKELIANAIMSTSKRKSKSFVKINCSALPPDILASELFGHVKGAYTGASKDRIGRFEYADGGTLFLDEIGEMPLNVQAQILRILQYGTFERVGDSFTRKVNVRIIAATNKNLHQEVKRKAFREDLYFRLNVIPIHVPPLRYRKDDVETLSEYFLKKYARMYNKNISYVSKKALELLLKHDWPGNIRELENSIEYAIVRSKREESLCTCALPESIKNIDDCQEVTDYNSGLSEKDEQILKLLREHNWNQSKVAEILGVNRTTIYRRLKVINSTC